MFTKIKDCLCNLIENAFPNCTLQYFISCCTAHRNTPLGPLSRGEYSCHKYLVIKQKIVYKPPLLRGAGGV